MVEYMGYIQRRCFLLDFSCIYIVYKQWFARVQSCLLLT